MITSIMEGIMHSVFVTLYCMQSILATYPQIPIDSL